MRIVLATPLYPPDIAEPAPYVKELATRLAELHTVTVIAYTRFPEKIPGVTIIAVNKQSVLPIRLITYFWTLLTKSAGADLIYTQNGASVELPLLILSYLRSIRLYVGMGDRGAHTRASHSPFLRFIERSLFARATRVIEKLPPPRPEIIPLDPYPTDAMNTYEEAWATHVKELTEWFTYGKA